MGHRLRPGLTIVRRDERQVQVGLEPPHRVVLPDSPDVRRLLDDLTHGRSPTVREPATHAVLERLARADLLEPDPPAAATAAPVTVQGPPVLVEAAGAHLRSAGLSVAADAPVRVILAFGAVRRDLLDPFMRSGTAHLVAALTPWGWDIGPFVVPGATACLRCVDAALAEHDQRHGVLVDQVARSGTALPVDAPSAAMALGWLARDVRAFGRGERPTTWSSTYRLGDGAPVERRWLRHPHCGCAWDCLD